MKFKVGLVVVCAGKSKRLGKLDKASLRIADEPLFAKTIRAFEEIKQIKQIVLVLRKKNFRLAKKSIKDERVILVQGGKERKHSVLNGVAALDKGIDYVLIHDGARPFIRKNIILNILKELKKYPAVICALRVPDTLKRESRGYAVKTLDRRSVYLAQTPQAFKRELLTKAYSNSANKNVTDSSSAVEVFGKKVKIVEGDVGNFKITHPQDVKLANKIACTGDYRSGLGFDVHKFSKKKKDLILGGVKIPSDISLDAVSDGDVLLHAVSDALCGVGCLGDIGDYFPPESKSSKGISSRKIIEVILKKLGNKFKLLSADIIIITDKPRLVTYKAKILKSLKNILSTSNINLKIKSKEGIEILGGKNAMSCFANILAKI